ncbi:diacylglycerol kinase [Fusobacterium varium]
MWIAELFNTAIESCVDMVTEEYPPFGKTCKRYSSKCCIGYSS